MQNKKLDGIRPAKGVKIKNKTQEVNAPEQVAPKVIQNVPLAEDVASPPTAESLQINFVVNEAREKLIKAMKDFNKILSNSVLSENKSIKEKEDEQQIVDNLTEAAQVIDKYSGGEGTLALCIYAIRQSLLLRDAGNRLAYEINEIKKSLNPQKTETKNVDMDAITAAISKAVKDSLKTDGE